MLGEKAELVARTADLEERLREAETAVIATKGTSRTASPEVNAVLHPALPVRVGETAHKTKEEEDAVVAVTGTETNDGRATGWMEHDGGEGTMQQQQQVATEYKQARLAASQPKGAEVDYLRSELETARAEQARVVVVAAEEREASARRVSELEVAIAETKLEYRRHRDRAESRLETLRVAFDQENEENDSQVG